MTTRHLFGRLSDEWAALGCSGGARDALARWARSEPALASFHDLAQVVDGCHRRGDPAAANRLLGALLRTAAHDRLAARALLQALLPGLAALSGRAQRLGWCRASGVWACRGELDQELLAVACERIAALAGLDLAWPASTIVGQVWRRARMAVDAHRDQRRRHTPLDAGLVDQTRVDAGEGWEQQLTRLLCDAVHQGTVAHRDGAAIYSTRVMGLTPVEVADRLDVDVRALWQRRRRAERTLAAALGPAA